MLELTVHPLKLLNKKRLIRSIMYVENNWQEWLMVFGYVTLAGFVTWQVFDRSR
jgi:hypothetical protein